MAEKNINTDEKVVERNILLSGKIMQFLTENPKVFDSLPDNFELVILPDDDPDLRQFNLDLLDKYGSKGKPIVFARIKAKPEHLQVRVKPIIFVPVNIAA